MASGLLTPLSWVYRGATTLRNQLFDRDILTPQSLSVPVVSVGNITAGGTGKTPMAIHLTRVLTEKGKKVGIISRGYGRKKTGTLEVTHELGTDGGDEPALMKRALGHVPIFVSSSRVAAGQALLSKYPVDIILADDAFQHRYLKRNMDIVLLDSTQSLQEYETLPMGRARESLFGLQRANQLIFTKVNSTNSTSIDELKNFLAPYVSELLLSSALEAKYFLDEPISVSGDDQWQNTQPVKLVSAIGRPETFGAMCKESLKLNIDQHLIYKDHHQYSIADVRSVGKGPVLTTEKDLVKLLALKCDLSNWFYVPLQVELLGHSEKVYEEIFGLLS